MLQAPEQKYEYAYGDSAFTCAHDFLIKPLLSMLPKSSGRQKIRVLDLGCGNGCLANLLAQQGYEVVGVEESASGVDIAQKAFPDCDFIKGSIYDLPPSITNNAFDVVISVEVIEHLYYPKELVKAAEKCLRPGGQLILTTPYNGYLKNIAISVAGKMDKHVTALWDGGHIKFFSVKTLRTLLETEGFEDIQFKFTGRAPFLWKAMLCSSTPGKTNR
jgi:2-polyprenyl-3-methyl-5-hydroxy-6-metoxy-1,4-benzoquinol methylase